MNIRLSNYRCFLLTLLFLSSIRFASAQQKLGDNLGNHTATKTLDINNHDIVGVKGMVIGSGSISNNSVILDLQSSSQAVVIPRITNIQSIPSGNLINGMIAYDNLTNKFYVRENGAWSAFGSFKMDPTQILIGNKLGVAQPTTVEGDVTIGYHPLDAENGIPIADRIYKTRISPKSVTIGMLRPNEQLDIEKVYSTNERGIAELISKSDLAIPKFSTAARDAKYSSTNPAAGNTFIFNTDRRELQVFDNTLLPAPGAWVALGTAPASNLPVLSTAAPTNLSQPDEVTLSGTISSDGGFSVTTRGIAYSLTAGASVTNFVANATAAGTGTFLVTIQGLKAGTTYYARAYATNSIGTAYGNEVTFVTGAAIAPIVKTNTEVSDITAYSATLSGDVINDKGSAVTARGIVWSTGTNPTIGLPASTSVEGSGLGNFLTTATNLLGNTTYYVRSFATNTKGTGYGANINFTTAAATAPVLDLTSDVVKTGSIATSGGRVIGTGGAPITRKGIAWNTTNVFPTTLTTSNSVNEGSTNTGTFSSNLGSLNEGTLYYVWAYATNSVGTSYAPPVSFTTNGLAASTGTTTFNPTGAMQTFTVPAGVTSVLIKAYGARGGSNTRLNSTTTLPGGLGGSAAGRLPVTGGQILYVFVGGNGINNTGSDGNARAGGYNGGGSSNAANGQSANDTGGGGGGASDVRVGGTALTNRVIVAGGGGGAHSNNGGLGGGLMGAPGSEFSSSGGGGTQSAGGTGAGTNSTSTTQGGPGYLGNGGSGGAAYKNPDGSIAYGGAGGGGGYYGGGGGSGGPGGGGSGFIGPTISGGYFDVSSTAGKVVISW
jgi:hypothetical protein